jgi:hypothetical protein
VEQLQALLQELVDREGNACDVSARVIETGNEAECYGVCAHQKTMGIVEVAAFAARAARLLP